MADLYRKKGDDEQELYWLDQNRMINDSICTLYDKNVIYKLNKMKEAELKRKNDERVEEIAYSILDRRNNGTSERNIKNCIPAAEMLRYAQTWSRYLEYRIKEKGENLDHYFEFIQDFEEYYNNQISNIHNNRNIMENAEMVKENYRSKIEMMPKNK